MNSTFLLVLLCLSGLLRLPTGGEQGPETQEAGNENSGRIFFLCYSPRIEIRASYPALAGVPASSCLPFLQLRGVSTCVVFMRAYGDTSAVQIRALRLTSASKYMCMFSPGRERIGSLPWRYHEK